MYHVAVVVEPYLGCDCLISSSPSIRSFGSWLPMTCEGVSFAVTAQTGLEGRAVPGLGVDLERVSGLRVVLDVSGSCKASMASRPWSTGHC